MDKKTFKEWRKEKGITASFVAKKLGITEQCLYNKEQGKSEWKLNEGLMLFSIYNVEADQVILDN